MGNSSGFPCCQDSVLSSIICCTSSPAAAVVSGALSPAMHSRNIACCSRNMSSTPKLRGAGAVARVEQLREGKGKKLRCLQLCGVADALVQVHRHE